MASLRFVQIFRWLFSFTGKFFALSFFVNILTWFLLWKMAFSGVRDSVLHYNVAYGVDMVDSAGKVFLLPTTGLVIFIANMILAVSAGKHQLARRLAAVFSFLVSLILLFASWLLIRFVL